MSERKLATVRVIESIMPIEGADKIEKAIIDGWSVVIQKGDYFTGQKIIMAEGLEKEIFPVEVLVEYFQSEPDEGLMLFCHLREFY